MRKILYILLLLPVIGNAQIKLFGNAADIYQGAYEHYIISSTNDTTIREAAATGNITTKGLTKSRRFQATDTIGNGSSEPAFNIERTLSSELSGQAVGYNERTTLTRAQSTTYNAYLLQTNIGGSVSGNYGLCIGFNSNPGVNVTDTMTQWRGFLSQGAINNSTGRVREWYGLYYQEPSGSGQIYDKHAAIRIQNFTKGTNKWAIQSYASAPSAFLGNVGIGIATDTVPRRRLELGAGTTAVAPLGLNSGTALTTPVDGSLEYHSSHLYFTIGSTRYQLDQQGGGSGTVTSVGLSTPPWLSVSGSPITTSGTLAVTAATGQTANQFLATPDGSTGAVGLRAIVAADIPTLNQNTTGSAATLTTTRTIWGQNFNGSANVSGTLAMGTADITSTGSLGATGARLTKGWFTDIESTNVPTVGGVALPTASSSTTFTNKTIAYGSNTITGLPVEIGIAVSDETTAITTGTAKVTFRMPHAMTVTAVRANVNTVSSSGTPTVDINEGGSSILGTKLSIDASEKTSTTAASAATITDASLADDAEITIDIDVAGTGAKGLKVWIIGTR